MASAASLERQLSADAPKAAQQLGKDFKSALCVLPPRHLWAPLQDVRCADVAPCADRETLLGSLHHMEASAHGLAPHRLPDTRACSPAVNTSH